MGQFKLKIVLPEVIIEVYIINSTYRSAIFYWGCNLKMIITGHDKNTISDFCKKNYVKVFIGSKKINMPLSLEHFSSKNTLKNSVFHIL